VLTTRQFAARHAEFARRGVAIARIFRSPIDALRDHASGPHALPFDVLGDPQKRVYRLFGVGASWLSLFTLAAGQRIREARGSGLRSHWRDALRDGIGGSPADFLIGADGRLLRVHYGEHFADSITPATALEWIDAASAEPADSRSE
jgi:peroxiredoxin